MTDFSLFGRELFIVYSAVGHLGLVLACAATAALAFLLRQPLLARLAAPKRGSAKLAGALLAGAVGIALLAGLRVSGTAYDPSEPALLWEWLTAVAAGAGVVAASYAAGGAIAALASGRGAPGAAAMHPDTAHDELAAALAAFSTLQAATSRLAQSQREAAARAAQVSDGAAAAEYVRAAEAIRLRLQLAEELMTTAGTAVLRLAAGAPLRRVLDRRPDAALARLNDRADALPLHARTEAALVAVRAFLVEVERGRGELERERQGAPGSVAQRVGLDASERVRPFEAALAQLHDTYARAGHRIEALRLRVGAESDASAAAAAAMAVSAAPRAPATDVVQVAIEMTHAEQSAITALSALAAEPSHIAEVVMRASSSLARDLGDDDGLAEVLRSVRQELER